MNSEAQPTANYQSTVRNIMNMLQQGRVDEAETACVALSRSNPESNDALLLLGRARQMQGRSDEMLQLVETALGREPQNVSLQFQFAGACQLCGQHDRALAQLSQIEKEGGKNAALLQNVAQAYVHSGKYADAHRCFLRAVELDGKNPQFLKNLATSFIAMGNLRKAEETYSKHISRSPDDFEAWYNRSTLRKQTVKKNYTRKLEKVLNSLVPDNAGETALCYALAKEYEDLGKNERSFSYLERGAGSLRRRMNYDVALDVSLMKQISELFDHEYAANMKQASVRRGPIFILGLPRSGTTLVDRIISSHSDVESMGEITDFAMSLNRVCQTSDREQLLEASARIDPEELGQSYIRSVASRGLKASYFIDKTLTNYLYIGLIAKSLPGASIINVQRHPVDSCLSMYRVLFRTGYPFSYDLEELADYYIAYHKLMRHWRAEFPDTLFDVSYEDLVDNQARLSREIIAHCGIDWEPACLEFDSNTAPVATASAAQVREPIHRNALARWRRFETQLTPLIRRLEMAGIEV